MTTRIIIAPATLGSRGQRFSVIFNGSVLLEASPAPEFEACRALIAQGVTGRLEVWWQGAAFSAMRLDIEKGARLISTEGELTSPRIVGWRPFGESEPQNVAGVVRAAAGRAKRVLGHLDPIPPPSRVFGPPRGERRTIGKAA